ncbi:MAG TPA: lipo-like protein [Xanthomonadales bacterium]|nr:lipo-like protein [Xanthomonadales bacterium]
MPAPFAWLCERIGRALAAYLSAPSRTPPHGPTHRPEALLATLRTGDVLLVEGGSRVSTAIKYLTQSTWSHAALCFRTPGELPADQRLDAPVLVEADLREGVRTVAMREYLGHHTRICRPVGLPPDQLDIVTRHMLDRVGNRYDLKNIIDLARYLIRTPPVPERHRRRMLALGSGDPTRAICSSLLAQAFQAVSYPVLPEVERSPDGRLDADQREILHIRHHSLFAPRDFDISPYFRIIKPTLECGFDFRMMRWSEPDAGPEDPGRPG